MHSVVEKLSRLFVVLGLCSASNVFAAESLNHLLGLYEVSLENQSQQVKLNAAEQKKRSFEAHYGFKLSATFDARYIEPSKFSFIKNSNDSRVDVLLQKTVWDFGYRNKRRQLLDGDITFQGLEQEHTKLKWRSSIVAAYFDVLLSDLQFAVANERMAIEYIRYDRAKDEVEVERMTEAELATKNQVLQESRVAKLVAEQEQLITRSRLANLIDGTAKLSDLELPNLKVLEQATPEFEVLVEKLSQSPSLALMEQKRQNLMLEAKAAKGQLRPRVSAQIRNSAYQQDSGERSPYQADVMLEIPLWDGGQVRSEIALLEIQQQELDLEMRSHVQELKMILRTIIHEIDEQKTQLDLADARYEAADLNLEKARALYELELTSDLGNSMVDQSIAQYLSAKAEYELALAWMNLAILFGDSSFDPESSLSINDLARNLSKQ